MRFRHNAFGTIPLLSDYPFVFSFGCAISFCKRRTLAQSQLVRFAGKAGFCHFPFAFSSLISLPDRDCDTDALHTPFVGSSFDTPFHDAAYKLSEWHILSCRFHQKRTARFPDLYSFRSPAGAGNFCVCGRIGLSCPRTRCDLFCLAFFATAFPLKSSYRFSLQS